MKRFISLILVWGMVWTLGCATNRANPDDPDALFKEAEEAYKDEHYLVALERFRDIKNRFPYSSKAVEAELRIADTYFAQESYLESESAYEIFRELHPTHPRIDYVQFQIGMSYYNQIPDHPGRDLSAAYRATDAFQALLDKFPSSSYGGQAKERIQQARQRLADYQKLVAEFYFLRKHYLSASQRYAGLLKDYPGFGYDEEALYRLGESYYHVRMYGEAEAALRQLLSKYPASDFKDRSLAVLKELEKSANP